MSEKISIDQLRNNPLFAMSLSSKELFHSNFWAWLIERNIEYAKIFFPDDEKLKSLDNVKLVTREEKHRDVTVWQAEIEGKSTKYDEAFVIENKFKSIPTMEQILSYQEVLEKDGIKFCRGLLTGIEKPDFMSEKKLEKWKFLSYGEIGQRIVKVAENTGVEKSGSFEQTLISAYGEMIQKLEILLLKKINQTGKNWKTYDEELSEIRFDDIFGKLNASRFEKYLNKHLCTLPREIGDYKLIIEAYYGQKGAGVDIRYLIPDDKLYINEDRIHVNKAFEKELSGLGVQIEATQYRWCATKAKCMTKYGVDTDEFFNEFNGDDKKCQYGWFVNYNHLDFKNGKTKFIRDHNTNSLRKTTMGAVKNKTKPYAYRLYTSDGKGAYTFMYQYWSLDRNDGLLYSFNELTKNIKRDMEKAAELLRKKQGLISVK